jgi:hypothetical protein
MKKSILAIALMAALSAQAQITGFAGLDYTKADSNSWKSGYEWRTGAAYKTSIGTFDAAVIYNVEHTQTTNNSFGGEAGYSLGTKWNDFGLTGRIAAGGYDSANYYVLQGEAKYALDKEFQPVVQYRFRDGFDSAYLAQNRFLFGFDLAASKEIAMRLGYTYTLVKDADLSGLTVGIVADF